MIDVHTHLTDNRFDNDLQSVLDQARSVGIKAFVSCATQPINWLKTIELTSPDIFGFIGTHPWDCEQHNQTLLENLLAEHPHLNVGEIGLDGLKPEKYQRTVFEQQFFLAAELNRSVVIHCLKRHDVLKSILKNAKKLPAKIMLHSFSGTTQDIDFYNHFSCYYSFSGRSNKFDIMKSVPFDKLLVETDSPDQRPDDDLCFNPNEKRNVPANLVLILDRIAAITGISKQQITANAKAFING